MEKKEFQNKYGFPKPTDSKERDIIIMSNLSNIQAEGFLTPLELKTKLDELKQFIIDSRL